MIQMANLIIPKTIKNNFQSSVFALQGTHVGVILNTKTTERLFLENQLFQTLCAVTFLAKHQSLNAKVSIMQKFPSLH